MSEKNPIHDEELLPLRILSTEVTSAREGGKSVHYTTLYRWATKGLHGVKLEAVATGGHLSSSREALRRFYDALASARAV